MSALRSAVKAGVEQLLRALHRAGLAQRISPPARLVLAYHNIVPRGEKPVGDLSLHLAQDVFAAQLDALLDHAEVVSLNDLLDGPNPSDRLRVAITWDDAYRGAVTAGFEELSRRNLPATLFVAPGCLGGFEFWWDALADPVGGLMAGIRAMALDEASGLTARVRSLAQKHGWPWRRLPAFATTAAEDELRALSRAPGVTLGAHTWNHPNLTRLTPDERREELVRPLEWLGACPGATLPQLAYPYGLADADVKRDVAAAGYLGALLVEGAWWRGPVADRFAIPRFNVSAGLSDAGFELRLYGRITR